MIEDLFDKGNDQDWERFFEIFRVDSFKKTVTFDELHTVLSFITDYNREKFDKYLFNSAYEKIEIQGRKPSENMCELHDMMKKKFFEAGFKIYSFFVENSRKVRSFGENPYRIHSPNEDMECLDYTNENPYRLHLDFKEDDLHGPIDFEIEDNTFYDEHLKSTNIFPWVNKRKAFKPYIVE